MRIKNWYRAFAKECPDGRLTREHLIRLFKKVFPLGDGEVFCEHIFRVFDDDGNNSLEFRVSLDQQIFHTLIRLNTPY